MLRLEPSLVMASILVTGFPGFLASNLIPRILRRRPDAHVTALVEGRFLRLAEERLHRWESSLRERVTLLQGDICQEGLGLDTPLAGIHEIYHLAALYDLNCRRADGIKVNVVGTTNVLRFAETQPDLKYLHYISTCYISGRYTGPFRETDLDKRQSFNNYYEETKFLAEVEVQRSRLPWVTYRPSIVVGDSLTGATLKYDGPYPVIKWLLKQPGVAIMPMIGDPTMTRLNLVTSDYVLDAMSHISLNTREPGQVYQLADPDPLTVDELVTELAKGCRRWVVRVPVPKGLTKAALEKLPWISRFSGFTPAMVDYFVHPTYYLADNTQAALAGSGIQCPNIRQVLPNLIAYVKRHPQPAG